MRSPLIVQNRYVARGAFDQKLSDVGQVGEEVRPEHRTENEAPGEQEQHGIGPNPAPAGAWVRFVPIIVLVK
jgi:hypothetical protein